MKTIYELQQIADRLRASTEVNSISPEDTFGLQADVLEYLADMEQNAEGLGIHQVYASYAAMLADASSPVGSNGKPLRFGQLVVIYDSSNTTQAESGNVYAWQKGNTGASAWKLMGNLGNVHALQSQIDSLLSSDESMKGKLTELETTINGNGTRMIVPNVGGNEVVSIEVNAGDIIEVSAISSVALSASSYVKLILNSAQIYTSVLIRSGATEGVMPPYQVVNGGTLEIIFEYNDYTENTITFNISPSTPGLVNELSDLKTHVDTFSSAIDEIQDTIDGEVKNLSSNEIVNDSYRLITGEIAPHESYFYTNPIPVKKGEVVATTEAMSMVPNISYLSAVTSSNGFIKSLVGGTTETKVLNYVIEEDGYISICYIKSRTYIFLHKKIGLKGQVDYLNEDLSNVRIETDTHLPIITENPLSKIMRDAGYGGIIRKWGFIGDSYSSGETPAKLNGVLTNNMDMYALSWGQQLMRIIGAEGYNFSNGGQTAKGWIRKQGTIHDASYIGGVGGGDWELAKQTENLKQAYIISLGINDRGKIASGKPYLGDIYTLGDVDIDVNLNDYTQNNENTWAGCYAGIIQRIKSVQPKAKIFCITQFGNALKPLNDVIRQMPSLFSNVYVLDFYQYAFDFVNSGVAGYMSYGHPTPLSYQYMAYLTNTYIDYIIRTNMAAFKDVSLIGTDYTL